MAAVQKEIAKRLGLSIATVSRALNGSSAISSETRAKVLREAAKTGYRLEARRTKEPPSDSMKSIGFVFSEKPLDSVYNMVIIGRILRGVAEEARRRDVDLHVEMLLPDSSKDEILASAERARSWDGCILTGRLPKGALSEFAKANAGSIQISYASPEERIDCVDHDEMASCETLVDLLWRKGHRRIGIFNASPPAAHHVSARFAGFCGALARRGAFPELASAIGIKEEAASFDEAAELALARTRDGVTAWVCIDDHLGYRLVLKLKEAGFPCPSKVSVCGFDNFDPPPGLMKLCSIDPPFEEMGVKALNALLGRIGAFSAGTSRTIMKCKLVEGGSIGRNHES